MSDKKISLMEILRFWEKEENRLKENKEEQKKGRKLKKTEKEATPFRRPFPDPFPENLLRLFFTLWVLFLFCKVIFRDPPEIPSKTSINRRGKTWAIAFRRFF